MTETLAMTFRGRLSRSAWVICNKGLNSKTHTPKKKKKKDLIQLFMT